MKCRSTSVRCKKQRFDDDFRECTMPLYCASVTWRVSVVGMTTHFEPGSACTEPAILELSSDSRTLMVHNVVPTTSPSFSWTFCLARSIVTKAFGFARLLPTSARNQFPTSLINRNMQTPADIAGPLRCFFGYCLCKSSLTRFSQRVASRFPREVALRFLWGLPQCPVRAVACR